MIPSPTPSYSLAGGSSEVGRTTETVALGILTDRYLQQTERVTKAIEYVLERRDKTDIELINLIYWKGTYTAEGAGLKVGLSKSATYRHINDIITEIARELGYVS